MRLIYTVARLGNALLLETGIRGMPSKYRTTSSSSSRSAPPASPRSTRAHPLFVAHTPTRRSCPSTKASSSRSQNLPRLGRHHQAFRRHEHDLKSSHVLGSLSLLVACSALAMHWTLLRSHLCIARDKIPFAVIMHQNLKGE